MPRSIPTLEQVLRGDLAALGAAITLAERDDPAARDLLGALRARAGAAFRVGITGPPGAGKSSILREVARRLRAEGEKVAIVACDPVSPFTGGAVLGDRYRLAALAQDTGVFFRSIAHRALPGEPCPAAREAADVLDAAGYPWVLVETVGTGQADARALEGSRLKVLVHSSGNGDEVQMLKAGIAEAADIHVVNKCDRSGTAAWAAELAASLSPGRDPPARVFAVSALTGEGMDAFVAELRERRSAP